VNLSDRRGGDGTLLEVREQLSDREAEILLDDLLDVGEGERADIVLKAAELGDDVGREHVGPCRQQLPELDEGRPELVEHLAQVLPALRGLPVQLEPRAAAREEVGQAVRVEPVAEAVADSDLSDLGEAP